VTMLIYLSASCDVGYIISILQNINVFYEPFKQIKMLNWTNWQKLNYN